MKTKTFIFVHDQKIIQDFISINKFKSLGDVTYIFVGDKPTNEVEKFPNVIICRNLPHNIEEYPKLTSYTGWYAIWKNNLYKDCDTINLFEYDVNLSNLFMDEFNKYKDFEVIGYIPLNVHHSSYVKNELWAKIIKESIYKNYKIDVLEFINNLSFFKNCGVTSNHSFKTKVFEEYMNWVEPLIKDIKLSKYSGHEVERSISLFYLLKNKKYFIIENILSHFQFDSHRTQEINPDKFINNYHKLLE